MNDPITKPSRLTRRRKKRWKIAKIADLIKSGLTDCYRVAILSTSCSSKIRIGVLEYTAQAAINAVFLCAKSQFLIIMSGWVGSRKTGRVVCPVRQPTQSGPMIGVMLSGLKTFAHGTQS